MKAGVFRLVHHAHSATTKLLHDPVMGNSLADHWRAMLRDPRWQVNAMGRWFLQGQPACTLLSVGLSSSWREGVDYKLMSARESLREWEVGSPTTHFSSKSGERCCFHWGNIFWFWDFQASSGTHFAGNETTTMCFFPSLGFSRRSACMRLLTSSERLYCLQQLLCTFQI